MPTENVMDQRTVNINRLKLIAIFAVAVVPVMLAFVMYFGGVAIPSSKTNKGTLIWPPIHIEALNSKSQLESQISVSESLLSTKKWTLLITGGEVCDQACNDLIHTVRQVNVSMAKEMDRVSRMLVSSLGAVDLVPLEEQYPNMVAHTLDQETISSFRALALESGAEKTSDASSLWQVWIVDPLGNVVIQYTDKQDGYDMIHDLKKLLKLSNIG